MISKRKNAVLKVNRTLLAGILVFSIVASILPCSNIEVSRADVTDNISTAVIEQTVGTWDDTKESHTVIGLLRQIIDKLATQFDKLASLETKVGTLDEKIDLQTVSLTESIEGISQAANASYTLYVYIPKSEALVDYSGQRVTITSSSGNQSAYATLRDDGTNYSTTLYFNFSGNCTLSYKFLYTTNDTVDYRTTVNIAATGQEQKLVSSNFTTAWGPIHNILQAGEAEANGLTTPGTALPDGWYVVSSGKENGKDTLFIWKKQNLGNMIWSSANNTATSYYNTFNSGYDTPNLAYSSRLLSYDEVYNGTWIKDNRTTGFNYWLETANSSGGHWIVYSDGSVSNYTYDSGSYGCCPGVWIH